MQTFQHKAPHECRSLLGFLQAAVPVDGTAPFPRQVIVCRTDTYCTACLSPWQPAEIVNKGVGLPIYQRQQRVEGWGSEWEERKEQNEQKRGNDRQKLRTKQKQKNMTLAAGGLKIGKKQESKLKQGKWRQ